MLAALVANKRIQSIHNNTAWLIARQRLHRTLVGSHSLPVKRIYTYDGRQCFHNLEDRPGIFKIFIFQNSGEYAAVARWIELIVIERRNRLQPQGWGGSVAISTPRNSRFPVFSSSKVVIARSVIFEIR